MDADAAFDTLAFRAALGRFATGVAVVVTRCPDGRTAAMTINSFASVSLRPPLVLWSMQNDTASARVYHDAGGFTVSLLKHDQEPAARLFARSSSDKLSDAAFALAPSGLPRLIGAAAWFDCARWETYAAGDHDLHIGRVLAFGTEAGATLTFHDGRFGASGA